MDNLLVVKFDGLIGGCLCQNVVYPAATRPRNPDELYVVAAFHAKRIRQPFNHRRSFDLYTARNLVLHSPTNLGATFFNEAEDKVRCGFCTFCPTSSIPYAKTQKCQRKSPSIGFPLSLAKRDVNIW